jgi:hypothetical protein
MVFHCSVAKRNSFFYMDGIRCLIALLSGEWVDVVTARDWAVWGRGFSVRV